MAELKPLSKEGIPKALEKADRYRLLNEPAEAESICLDILEADPENQRAVVILILTLTDQFGHGHVIADQNIQQLLRRLKDPYEKAYYTGVVCERRGKAALNSRAPSSVAYEWLSEAMEWYQEAEAIRPAGNDDALLRWNTCARIFERNPNLQPMERETAEPYLE